MTGSGATPTILIADDEPDVLDLVAYRLSHSGYQVLAASDGQQALDLARDRSPDLALLDVMMPKLDGYELTRALRSEEGTRQMPVILLTARVQESDVGRGFDAGADDYLKKPFNPDELVARVRAVLGRR